MNFELPKIVVGVTDFARLMALAEASTKKSPAVAETLARELDRAQVKPDHKLASNIVKMGSELTYKTTNGEQRRVKLVYPCDADISTGKISILSPIGAALIGLSVGQSINWSTPGGSTHLLTIVSVTDDRDFTSRAAMENLAC